MNTIVKNTSTANFSTSPKLLTINQSINQSINPYLQDFHVFINIICIFRGEYLGRRGMKMRSGEGNEELSRLLSSNIVSVNTFRNLRRGDHIASMEEDRATF